MGSEGVKWIRRLPREPAAYCWICRRLIAPGRGVWLMRGDRRVLALCPLHDREAYRRQAEFGAALLRDRG